ncbi:hypothetical protein K435DRAFT_597669, partial [Dendrothele bispora CBS 962.96]
NSDVTSLLSGTAIKTVVAYVSDYITKWSLNTHVIFDVIQTVLRRNTELTSGFTTCQEKVRRLVTQMVNLLSVRMELGAPMICMYLLDQPDHYTSHKFVPIHWKSYVTEAQNAWEKDQTELQKLDHKVMLIRKNGRIFGLSKVYDYIYRPSDLENMTLYNWVTLCERVSISKKYQNKDTESDCDLDVECESDAEMDEESNQLEAEESDTEGSSFPIPVTKDNLPENIFPFLYGHPLADSHGIKLLSERNVLVPNFIGPGLPRKDKGDREYY